MLAKRHTWRCPSCGWIERPRKDKLSVILCPACKVLMTLSIKKAGRKKKKYARKGTRALRLLNDLDAIRREF